MDGIKYELRVLKVKTKVENINKNAKEQYKKQVNVIIK